MGKGGGGKELRGGGKVKSWPSFGSLFFEIFSIIAFKSASMGILLFSPSQSLNC